MRNLYDVKIFLDDLREATTVYPHDSDWIVVRDFEKFQDFIAAHGVPDTVSFDNDLGVDPEGNVLPEGYHALKWLIENDYYVKHILVHSDNVAASENIAVHAANWHKFLISEGLLQADDCSVVRMSALRRKWYM